jgi:hypothetical protein
MLLNAVLESQFGTFKGLSTCTLPLRCIGSACRIHQLVLRNVLEINEIVYVYDLYLNGRCFVISHSHRQCKS